MAASSTSLTNEIIITAMDRFVWFVLLVVMSHLVTEFTRVTGYARGPRVELPVVNDSLIQPKTVSNMVLYPGQENYGLGDRPYYYNNNNNNIQANANSPMVSSPVNNDQGSFFSFRPLIDSIFEIPISALRAVNNLVARLTAPFQQSPNQAGVLKSVGSADSFQAPHSNSITIDTAATSKASRKSLLREEIA